MNRANIGGVVALLVIAAGVAFLGGGEPEQKRIGPSNSELADKAQTDAALVSAQEKIIGIWQSADDAEFTRVFMQDGAVIDQHKGRASATARGTWYFFTLFHLPALETINGLPIRSDVLYLQIQIASTTTNFKVRNISEDLLETTYFNQGDNGENVNFTRIK